MQLVESIQTPLAVKGDKLLSGLFAELGTFNQNGRRYPEDIYEQAYEELVPKIQNRRLLGELDHPIDYDEVRLANVSHVITECYLTEGDDGVKVLRGTVELLDTPAGLIAQSLVKAGVPIGISSRGLGATKQVRDGVDVTQLKLITYDLVAEPSFASAVLSPAQSQELSDSLQYIEAKLPLNESVESRNVRDIISRIRESLINKETSPSDEINIDKVEIESLRSLLESTHDTIKTDTEVLAANRQQIKQLTQKLDEAQRKYKYVLNNMMKLQDAYNNLESSTVSKSQLDELNETVVELRRQLAVERRGMSYTKVSGLLEGANTDEEIESKLNSLSTLGKKRVTQVPASALTESTDTGKSKLSKLASIISQV